MFVDFGMAEQYNGVCYLRYDDTNPEAEKQVSGCHTALPHQHTALSRVQRMRLACVVAYAT